MIAITDGGSKMKCALKMMDIERYLCLEHNMHKCLMYDVLENSDIKDIMGLVAKLKEIYRTLTYKREEIPNIYNCAKAGRRSGSMSTLKLIFKNGSLFKRSTF